MSNTTSPEGPLRYKYENGKVWANFDQKTYRRLDQWRLCPSTFQEGWTVKMRMKDRGIVA